MNIVVGIDNSVGFCGTLNDSDFSYRAETVNGNVVFTFHPLANIAGCGYALIYVRQGGNGPYPGYQMTKIGNDFRFIQPVTDSIHLSIYFTYNVPAGGERNSSANPQAYTVGTKCAVATLPVQLLSYTATLQKSGSVALAWSTANEVNNNYFIIQKISYAPIAKVWGERTTANVHNYTAQDTFPSAGTNYYRLIQFDKDGAARIYGVKTVNINNNGAALTVYPNPVTGNVVTIRLGTPTLVKQNVRLFNLVGKLIYAGTITPSANMLNIKLAAKPAPGVYMLSIQGMATIKLLVL